ncbi:hypothetical protein [Phenylobacterium koreense]|uniref:DNA pilot protein n=1 Tax=Phenylobacterium koreense TaxID=266125 RepID=A0ABV2EGM2_9CAUL
MIAELISAGSSLLGGVINSGAADRAKDALETSNEQAQHARERAVNQTQQLQAPGVAAYNAGLNALAQRFGLPTNTGIAPQQTRGGAFNADEYLAANPDVLAEFQRLSPNAIKNNLGIDATPQAFAQWHYNQHGQYEKRPGSPSQVVDAPAPDPAASSAPATSGTTTNALNGYFGNVEDPTWTPPPAFSFDIDDFKDNPAYQFAQEQGSGQVMANASATGALQSGAALKRLQDRGQQTAYNFYDQERNNAYQQWLDTYKIARSEYEGDRGYLTDRYDRGTDDIFRLTGIGQTALNTTTNSINGLGAAEAAGLENIGEARAGNALAQGNIWSGVLQNLGGLASSFGGQTGVVNSLKTKTNRKS